MNSDDFFKAQALRKREEDIASLEAIKQERIEATEAEEAADRLLQEKGFDLTAETIASFTVPEIKILVKWSKAKPDGPPNKAALAAAYYDAPVPASAEPWRHVDEAELIQLRCDPISMKETAVAVAANQMARAVANNIGQPDAEVRRSLMDSLETSNTDGEGTTSATAPGAHSAIL